MARTVRDLRDAISDLPDDMPVILQKDAEGNGFSPLAIASASLVYVEETSWSGQIYDPAWEADGDEIPDGAYAVLLLGPVN